MTTKVLTEEPENKEMENEIIIDEVSSKPVFAIDLGNHHVKLKSEYGEYIYSSLYMDAKKLSPLGFGEPIEEAEIYQIGNDNSSFLWGNDSKFYNHNHHIEDLIDTYSHTKRFNKKSAQRLVEFALGKLSADFPDEISQSLNIRVILGAPFVASNRNNSFIIDAIKDIILGTHKISVDDKIVTVTIESKEDIVIIPEIMGTLINFAIEEDGTKNTDFIKGTHAIFDIGGGGVRANTFTNLNPDLNGIERFVGTQILIKTIMNNTGVTNAIAIKKMLYMSKPNEGYIYQPTNNVKDDIVMTDIVLEAIEDYTRNTIASFITSTFSDIESFDDIIMTGGGINLINIDALQEEIGDELFSKIKFTKDSELANVRGFYKINYLLSHS